MIDPRLIAREFVVRFAAMQMFFVNVGFSA